MVSELEDAMGKVPAGGQGVGRIFSKFHTFSHDRRLATDGLLEALVETRTTKKVWVPVVPAGYATKHLAWKRWTFVQVHVGLFGGHRSGKKTLVLLKEVAYWYKIQADILYE